MLSNSSFAESDQQPKLPIEKSELDDMLIAVIEYEAESLLQSFLDNKLQTVTAESFVNLRKEQQS